MSLAEEGKFSDLAENTHVLVQLSVDRKKALSVRVQGKGLMGTLKGIDTGTNFVTLTIKGESGPEDKMVKLAKDARVDPNAKAGDRVHVRLSVFDADTAVEIRVLE